MNRKIKAFLLAVAVLLCTALLYACGTSGDAAYEVKVLTAEGTPAAGVIVKFMQNGVQAAMQPVDNTGVAKKTLAKGDYTLELVFTETNTTGYCDPAEAILSASKTATTVTVYSRLAGEGVDLVADGKDYKAYHVGVGGTYVDVAKQTRNYFLFVPTEAGTYQISVNKDLTLGYYGSPFYVQAASAAEVKDNAFIVSVSPSMIGTDGTGTTTYVVGIDGGDSDTGCLLSIVRTGDPAWSVENEPWTEYKTTHTPAKFTLEQGGKKLTYVDIKGATADNQVIYNEADGYYHFGTADGPVVYINLGKEAPNVSLQIMIQGDGPMGGAPLRKYFWSSDEHNKESFVKREDYTNIMVSYFDNMDENLGVYPLTQDLVYIIQNACTGWWTSTSPDYILEGCNPELGWMFALCYLA